MLERLEVEGFKSLIREGVDFPRLAVLFGPNAAGKSNVLDAIQALSRIGTGRTLSEALSEPIRGYPIEAFSFPTGGLPELLSRTTARFDLKAVLRIQRDLYQYEVGVQVEPASGGLTVANEYLAALSSKRQPKGSPSIEVSPTGELRIRHAPRGAAGRSAGHRAARRGHRAVPVPPPFRERVAFPGCLQDSPDHHPERREARGGLDKRRGTLDILVRQHGIDFSSRIVSEGTLRVLALCAIAVNPWSGSLLAFEEPENGVHPRRLELIAELLVGMATEQGKQVVVTTHSPLFCDAMLRRSKEHPETIGLFRVFQREAGSQIRSFDPAGPLFESTDVVRGLTADAEDGVFEGLLLRGMLDE